MGKDLYRAVHVEGLEASVPSYIYPGRFAACNNGLHPFGRRSFERSSLSIDAWNPSYVHVLTIAEEQIR